MDSSPFSFPSAVGFVARALIFAGVIIPPGAVIFRLAVIGRASLSYDDRARLTRRAASIGMWTALLVVPGALARLYFQVALMRFPDEPWLAFAFKLLTASTWGYLWFLQLGFALLTSFLLRRSAWRAAAFVALCLVITPSLASHAMSAHPGPALTLPADMLHLIGAATWLGTLVTMFLAAISPFDGDGAKLESGATIAALLVPFSPLALLGATTIVASGAVSSYAHLQSVADLIRAPYGRLLAVKVVVVLLVAAFGWRNWRLMTPGVAEAGAGPLRRSIRLELIAAAIVLAVTSALVITPPPGH